MPRALMAAGLLITACTAAPSSARSALVLGTAEGFTVLAGSTVTNTGPTTIVGDLGVSPGLAITGFPPGMVTGGAVHVGDAVAQTSQADVVTAYDALAGRACGHDLSGQDLGGKTLTPGVYCFSSSAQLTGALTLDAEGDPDALFVFQIASTLTTASQASVLMINAAQGCHAFWQVGSSATLGTTTVFVGSILALTSITLTNGAQLSGRALARNGAVTMDTNHVAAATCALAAPVDAGAGDSQAASDAGAIDAATSGDAGAGAGDAGSVCHGHRCGDSCVDLRDDHDNCGACGNDCSWDSQCVAGACVCAATTCGDICVELDENPENCGACGHACAQGEWCDQGSCTASCAGTICDRWCTDLQTNDDACGACGHACGDAETCQAGVCVCTGTMCGSECVDLTSNARHCGTCGQTCGDDDCCTDSECVPLTSPKRPIAPPRH